MEKTSIQSIKTSIPAGTGITAMAREIAEGSLVLLERSEDLDADVLMVWRKNRR